MRNGLEMGRKNWRGGFRGLEKNANT